jgi:ubiquinone/menaquinone biosynthesis C-methylase UbiE
MHEDKKNELRHNVDEWLSNLASESRREWQNPEDILNSIGISKGMKIADLGCGPGFFTLEMAKLTGDKGIVYAVDVENKAIEYLRSRIKGDIHLEKVIKTINSEVSSTGIPNNSIDLVFFANVLHDIEDKELFFDEIKRIGKKDAVIVDVDWEKSNGKPRRGPPDSIIISRNEAKSLLEERGFKIEREIYAGPHHYGLVCRILEGEE